MAEEQVTPTETPKTDEELNAVLKQELINTIQFIRTEAGAGYAKTKELVPVVVREYIAYQRVTSTVAVSIFPIAFSIFLVILSRLMKNVSILAMQPENKYNKEYQALERKTEIQTGFTIGTGILSAFMFFMLMFSFPIFIKAWFAPTILVLEYAKGLL